MKYQFSKFCCPHAEISGISPWPDEPQCRPSILLIPCFQTKEAEFFALVKDPATNTWREFSPRCGESKEALLRRINRTMQAEHVARQRAA